MSKKKVINQRKVSKKDHFFQLANEFKLTLDNGTQRITGRVMMGEIHFSNGGLHKISNIVFKDGKAKILVRNKK